MRLIELEVSGFKSFAGKTIFRFTPGLTAIIGPNGSGKSNLAEAIRWVLGEQSLKQLRSREAMDVLFAGSSSRPKSNVARVSLTLTNETGRLGVAAPEVTLTRTIARSGESDYLLNGDSVRLFDIQHLLAEAGVGTKSYTVISQGMVDRYLTATPALRRELFDEATGVKALQLKLNRATSHLKQTEQQMAEVRRLLNELQPRLRVLKRQVTRHQEREATLVQFDQTQSSWYRAEWHRVHTTLEHTLAERARSRETLLAARNAREIVEQELLAAARTGPSDEGMALEAECHQAERAFEQALLAYEASVREREELTASLESTRRALAQAEQKLAQARRATEATHLFTTIRTVLHKCQEFLHKLNVAAPNPAEARALENDIREILPHVQGDSSLVHSAQSLIAELEGPLQATARLEAIAQERAKRLAALPEAVRPSDERVRELRARLKERGPRRDPRPELSHTLQSARAAEVAAERAEEAAVIAVQTAEQAEQSLEQEIQRERGTDFLAELNTILPTPDDMAIAKHELDRLAATLATLGEIDPLALQEYTEVAARCEHLEGQLSDIEAAGTSAQALIATLERTIQTRFRKQFSRIQEHFTHYFTHLFGGGTATLSIVDALPEPGESDLAEALPSVKGIEITAHPPGKQPQHIQLLSGGERALTSLALLLAIVKIQQPPFIVFDEVDASLDEANSFRFAELLQEMSTTTQCIVITHNRETMGLADVLYGVTMDGGGVSKCYSIKLEDIEETEKTEEIPV